MAEPPPPVSAVPDAREFLAFVLEAFGAAAYELNLRDGSIRHTPHLCNLFGYPEECTLTAEDFRARYHPDDRAAMSGIVDETIARGARFYEREFRIVLPGGEIRWLLTRGEVLRDAAGRAVRTRGATMDVTERRAVVEALRVSEARYRSLFTSISTGFALLEVLFGEDGTAVDARVLECNPALERLTGLREVAGKRVRELVPSLEDEWIAPLGRVARTGVPLRLEGRVAGLGRWIDVHAARAGGADSSTVAVVLDDVTPQKLAAEALRENATRQAFLVRLGDALRPLTDPGEIQRQASRVLREHLGASRVVYGEQQRDEGVKVVAADYANGVVAIAGVHRYEDYGPALLEEFRAGRITARDDVARDERLTPAQRATFEAIGSRAWAAAPLVKHGRLVALLVVHLPAPHAWTAGELALIEEVAERTRDAVERARAEAALRASEQKYRALFDSIDEGFALCELVYDAAGKPANVHYLEVNPSFGRLTGFLNAAGRDVTDYYAPLESSWLDLLATVVATGEARRVEHYARTLDRWFEVYCLRVGPASSRTCAVVFGDITERKRAEAALREALAAAEAARGEAENVNRVMNEFFARASHELRGPLGAMAMWLPLLRSAAPSQRDEAIAAIEQSVGRQTRLVADLLDMARGLSGKLRVERAPVDVLLAVETTLDEFQAEADARSITLDLSASDEPMWVLGDLERLQQAVANLLSNALKFSGAGTRVEVSVVREGERVQICVRDEGRGISPAFLPRLFTPYQQEDSSLTRAYGGLGLGLAIVKQIVELHGGSVAAESAGEGRGATFTIRLPLAPEGVVAAAGAARSRAPGTAGGVVGMRVLVVDDDAVLRGGLAAALEHLGASVMAAGSADEALEAIGRARFDVLLCDLAMPGKDGYALLRELRARPAGEGGVTPAVALSGQARPEDRARALQAGFQEHVAKPVVPRELAAVLARVVGLSPQA